MQILKYCKKLSKTYWLKEHLQALRLLSSVKAHRFWIKQFMSRMVHLLVINHLPQTTAFPGSLSVWSNHCKPESGNIVFIFLKLAALDAFVNSEDNEVQELLLSSGISKLAVSSCPSSPLLQPNRMISLIFICLLTTAYFGSPLPSPSSWENARLTQTTTQTKNCAARVFMINSCRLELNCNYESSNACIYIYILVVAMITLKDLIALSFKVQVSHYEDKQCIEYKGKTLWCTLVIS